MNPNQLRYNMLKNDENHKSHKQYRKLYNTLKTFEPQISKLLQNHAIQVTISDYENHRKYKQQVTQFCDSFISEFANASFSGDEYELEGSKLCIGGSYQMPRNSDIKNFEDLPTLGQIVTNHLNLYLKDPPGFFSSNVRLHAIAIRNDGYALMYIDSIETSEMICEPPYHELPGIEFKSGDYHSFANLRYVPFCVTKIDSEWIRRGKWKMIDFRHESSECIDANDGYTLSVDAGFYC